MTETYIVYAKRTMIGKFMGSLANIRAAELGAALIEEGISSGAIVPGDVDEVILGNVLAAGQGQNPARQAAIRGGLPYEVPAATINKVCGSGIYAMRLADNAIKAGSSQVVIAGGMENMSMSPYLLQGTRGGMKMGDQQMKDSMINDGLWDAFHDFHMGITAENVAEEYQISRKEQDTFALQSQQKAGKAIESGVFEEEIVPITFTDRRGNVSIIKVDEHARPNTTIDGLEKLRPAFKKDGTVTAGNASGVNDGAAVVLLCTKEYLEKHGLKPLAKIVSHASVGIDPAYMGMGPVGAIKKVLQQSSLKIDDIGLFEVNEAFASQSIAVIRELGLDQDKVNVNGGAIALGHPIGASGARIVISLLYEMRRREVQYGIASLCIGGGMGESILLERC